MSDSGVTFHFRHPSFRVKNGQMAVATGLMMELGYKPRRGTLLGDSGQWISFVHLMDIFARQEIQLTEDLKTPQQEDAGTATHLTLYTVTKGQVAANYIVSWVEEIGYSAEVQNLGGGSWMIKIPEMLAFAIKVIGQ